MKQTISENSQLINSPSTNDNYFKLYEQCGVYCGIHLLTPLSNQRRYTLALNEIKALLRSYQEFLDVEETDAFLEIEFKFLRQVHVSIPLKCDYLRSSLNKVLDTRNRTYLDNNTRHSVYLVYEIYFILYENFCAHLKIRHEGLDYVYPSLVNSNHLRRFNSVVLSKVDQLSVNPSQLIRVDEVLDIMGLLDEFVKAKACPFVLNVLNLFIQAKSQFTSRHRMLTNDLKNTKIKSKLFEYSHVVESTRYLLEKECKDLDLREYEELLRLIQESYFGNMHQSFRDTSYNFNNNNVTDFELSIKEQSLERISNSEELRKYIQMQYETKSYLNQEVNVKLNVRSILFVFEHSSNLKQIASNLKYLLDNIDYASCNLNDTIESTKITRKVSFSNLINHYELMSKINFMMQNVYLIVNNQGVNVYDFELLTLAFYIYELVWNYLKTYTLDNNSNSNENGTKSLDNMNLNHLDQNYSYYDDINERESVNSINYNNNTNKSDRMPERFVNNFSYLTCMLFRVVYEASYGIENQSPFRQAFAFMLNKYIKIIDLVFECSPRKSISAVGDIYVDIIEDVYRYIKDNSLGLNADRDNTELWKTSGKALNVDFEFFSKYEWLMRVEELREFVEMLYMNYLKSVVKTEQDLGWEERLNRA